MFCPNCGTKIEPNTQFCQNCGFKIESSNNKKIKPKVSNSSKSESSIMSDKALFYSEEWARTKHLAIVSVPHCDILITEENLYLIQFPKTHGATIGLFVGLGLFNLLGALIGASIGNSSDKNKRKERRSAWIDLNHNLVSQKYENNVFLKIPKSKLKSCLILKKNKFIVLAYNGETVTLKKNKKEYERFNKYVEPIADGQDKRIGYYNKENDNFLCNSCFKDEKVAREKYKGVKRHNLVKDIYTCDKCNKTFD